MTTELRTIPQTGTTASTADLPVMAIRKATKDPAGQTADQFAAMFAALCLVPLPQPVPAAKNEEAAPLPGIANPEIAGSDNALMSPTPGITLQPLIAVSGEGAMLETSAGSAGILPASFVGTQQAGKMPALPAAINLRQVPAPSSPPQGTASACELMEEMTPLLPVMNFPPSAKPQEPAPAYSIASPEIAGSDKARQSETPVNTLQTPIALSGQEALPKTAPKDLALPPGPPATLFSSELTSNVLPVWSKQTETTPAGSGVILPAAFVVTDQAGKIPALPTAITLPPPVSQAVNNQVEPIKPGYEAAPPKLGFRATVEADAVQNPQAGIGSIVPEPPLETEAAPRPAGMVGMYFPGYDPASVPAGGITSLAGNGFDHGGDGNEAESSFNSRLQFPSLAGDVSFASTVRDLESDASARSIQSQTISQILAQAETLTGRQTRSLRLRLRPEELGEIDIQLSRDAAGRISAHISAERESARVALSRSLDQLRETLSRAGLTVDKLQINAEPGLFAGNRESNDGGSNTRQSSSGVANLLTENEIEAGGQPRAEDGKLLSLHV